MPRSDNIFGMIMERLPELKTWSDYDKWQLVEELEAELTGQHHDVTEIPEVKEKLVAWMNKQLEAYRADPSLGSPWSEVRKRLTAAVQAPCKS